MAQQLRAFVAFGEDPPRFGSQHLHGDSQPPIITPVLGGPIPTCFCPGPAAGTHMIHRLACRPNTHTQEVNQPSAPASFTQRK